VLIPVTYSTATGWVARARKSRWFAREEPAPEPEERAASA